MNDRISRRAMVQALAVAAGFLLVPDPTGRAAAQNPRRRLYALVLNQAIATGDLRGAVERQRRVLDQREVDVFYRLTRADLAALGGFRARMAKLGVMEVIK